MCAKASNAASSFSPVLPPGSVGSCPSSEQMFLVALPLPPELWLDTNLHCTSLPSNKSANYVIELLHVLWEYYIMT